MSDYTYEKYGESWIELHGKYTLNALKKVVANFEKVVGTSERHLEASMLEVTSSLTKKDSSDE